MNIESLKYFYLIAEGYTFLDVAEENHISQSSVSKSIQKLEAGLGVKLFNRSFRSAKLTDAGECLYNDLQKIIPEFKQMMRNIKAFSQSRDISVCVVPSVFVVGIEKLLEIFSQNNPNISIKRFEEKDYRYAIKKLESSDIDFAIMHKPLINYSNINFTFICEDYLVAVFPPNHPLASKQSIYLSDLNDKRVVLDAWMNNAIREISLVKDINPNIILTSMVREINISYIADGHGMSLYYASDICPYKLENVTVRRVEDSPEQPFVLAVPKKNRLNKEHILLKEYLISELNDYMFF